ncbi:Peroxidase [Zostera marina]|uniref:Peroxidase n=1 Tax=Zostera marina TaxID=29655 RepID=A0A0K9Q1J0_ZOSMR|nr:Peroxidase [Zostera marina]
MAFSPLFHGLAFFLAALLLASTAADAQLCPNLYKKSCPQLEHIVRDIVKNAVAEETRMAAKLLRLHFHDCFVNGCGASITLDNTTTMDSEKDAPPNLNSIFGFEVIDDIKKQLEAACPGVVSCADILALSALYAVEEVGGPSWSLSFGRKDVLMANKSLASEVLPNQNSSVLELIENFARQNLNARDMTALSGGHTIGAARCLTFRPRIYNTTSIDSCFAATRQETCPRNFGDGDNNLAPLDDKTPGLFDNQYYKNLLAQRGLLPSDQVLFDNGSQDALVTLYATNQSAFFHDFATAMTKMSNIHPSRGTKGEIRTNCRRIN